MKYQQVMGLVLFCQCVVSVFAHSNYSHHSKESPIETAADLQEWCKLVSYRHFKRKKLVPYNWSVKTVRTVNDFESRGSWTVRNQHFAVICQVRKGKKAKHTKIEILPVL